MYHATINGYSTEVMLIQSKNFGRLVVLRIWTSMIKGNWIVCSEFIQKPSCIGDSLSCISLSGFRRMRWERVSNQMAWCGDRVVDAWLHLRGLKSRCSCIYLHVCISYACMEKKSSVPHVSLKKIINFSTRMIMENLKINQTGCQKMHCFFLKKTNRTSRLALVISFFMKYLTSPN